MALRQSRGKPVLALLALLLGACAPSSREIPEAGRFATDLGYYRGPAAMRVPGREAALPGRYVILAFSGGGTRAAALAHGVLRELEHTPAPDRPDLRMLDAVDMISSTSGGSVASANFVLHGRLGPEGYQRIAEPGGFLRHDGFEELASGVVNPLRIPAHAFSEGSRIELLSGMLARMVFGQATYGDLAAPGTSPWPAGRPLLVLNAADMASGERFSFTTAELALLCIDLRQVRIADAVTASAAFPVALSPLPLPNHSPCDAQDRDDRARRASIDPLYQDAGLSTLHLATACGGESAVIDMHSAPGRSRAVRLLPLLNRDACGRRLPTQDPRRIRRIHLLDGGVADNLGLDVPLATLTGGGADPRVRRAINGGAIEEVVVIAVNARSQASTRIGRDRSTPGPLSALLTTIGAAIDARSGGLMAQLSVLETVLRGSFGGPSCPPGRHRAGCPPRVRVIGIEFEALTDEACRTAFQNVSTNWTNSAAEVAALQELASGMLRASSGYRDLARLPDSEAATGRQRIEAACVRLTSGGAPPVTSRRAS